MPKIDPKTLTFAKDRPHRCKSVSHLFVYKMNMPAFHRCSVSCGRDSSYMQDERDDVSLVSSMTSMALLVLESDSW